LYVVFVGTAGCGKTTLTWSYSKWLRGNGFTVALVNLDPGVHKLPYNPDFDIRRIFTLSDLMIKYNLGPNAAFIKSGELILEYLDEIFSSKPFSEDYDYVLIDTPGQMEIFVFRDTGREFMRRLRKLGSVVVVYIVDGELVTSVSDLITLWLMSILIQSKFEVPVVPVVNKVDKVGDLTLPEVIVKNPSKLRECINVLERGLLAEVIGDVISIIEKASQSIRLVKLSALKSEGLEELHSILYEVFCTCGDLT